MAVLVAFRVGSGNCCGFEDVTMILTYEQRQCYACKVCGCVPNEEGERVHGRGCYTLSADGGGEDYVEFDQHYHVHDTYSIERIHALLAELAEFNSRDLSSITLTENGKPLEITPGMLDEWRFVGMANQSFVEVEFWKPENHVDLGIGKNDH